MRFLAIDGNSIMNRAFYGIKLLTNKKGEFTNAIVGFMNIYLKAVEELHPDAVAVAFDVSAPTFRHEVSTAYKANRKGMPEELRGQMPRIKSILSALGIKIIETPGFEADDILGTVSRLCSEQGHECWILTGDRDSLQLLDEKVSVRLATTKETIIFTPQKFKEVYGLEPLQLIDLKALMGDSSDNIPGVAGIGEKTASALISKFDSVENLYKKLENDEIPAGEISASVLTKLKNGKDAAFESKFLATIKRDIPIEQDLQSYVPSLPNAEECSKILTELEMFSLLERLDLKPSASVEPQKEDVPDIEAQDLTNEIVEKLNAEEIFTHIIFDGQKLKLLSGDKIYTTESKELILKLLCGGARKTVFDAKTCYKFAFENSLEAKNIIFDCYIAAYLLNPSAGQYTVERLCSEYKIPYFLQKGELSDILSLKALSAKLADELNKTGMDNLFYEIELPLTEVLAAMEHEGFLIDAKGVKDFGKILKDDLASLEERIYSIAGKKFNILSPKQLGEVLFEDLKLPPKKKTKTGYSTNAEVLEELSGKHPIIELILQYRQLSKLNSTYVEGLLKAVSPDGRIHSSFNQTETRTGRISSTEPNMQNIPVRTELGKNMRKFFAAKDGFVLLDADYSQIELRILAAVCGDKTMQEAFAEGHDIHAITASQVFGLPLEMVTPSMRRAAKAVNFGIIYGIGAFSLSKDIGVSVAEADRYIKEYLRHYPNVSKYMEKTVEDAVKNGFVTTIFNRRRYIPELSSSNKNIQAFGRRAAMNAPIQGSAADIIKIAMVKVYKRLKGEKLDARLILQVHDELIVEASEKDAETAAKILKEEMEGAAKLSVPLTVEVNKGKTWYDAKD
ncbi:MAG: DNA polymerase I [Oscillospiraceae bacterium]|nr:DNA polymerase I [Oscillospiraceae bacterium]